MRRQRPGVGRRLYGGQPAWPSGRARRPADARARHLEAGRLRPSESTDCNRKAFLPDLARRRGSPPGHGLFQCRSQRAAVWVRARAHRVRRRGPVEAAKGRARGHGVDPVYLGRRAARGGAEPSQPHLQRPRPRRGAPHLRVRPHALDLAPAPSPRIHRGLATAAARRSHHHVFRGRQQPRDAPRPARYGHDRAVDRAAPVARFGRSRRASRGRSHGRASRSEAGRQRRRRPVRRPHGRLRASRRGDLPGLWPERSGLGRGGQHPQAVQSPVRGAGVAGAASADRRTGRARRRRGFGARLQRHGGVLLPSGTDPSGVARRVATHRRSGPPRRRWLSLRRGAEQSPDRQRGRPQRLSPRSRSPLPRLAPRGRAVRGWRAFGSHRGRRITRRSGAQPRRRGG